MYWWIGTIFIVVLLLFAGFLLGGSWVSRNDTPKRDDVFDDPNVG